MQIAQVLVNLVVNAAQSLQPGGRLGLETRREKGAVLLVVRDNGPGMDASTLRRVFEPFFSTRPADVGTGLGLSVVRGIVLAHGGTIEAESEPGHGTAFLVRLPIHSNNGSEGNHDD